MVSQKLIQINNDYEKLPNNYNILFLIICTKYLLFINNISSLKFFLHSKKKH